MKSMTTCKNVYKKCVYKMLQTNGLLIWYTQLWLIFYDVLCSSWVAEVQQTTLVKV